MRSYLVAAVAVAWLAPAAAHAQTSDTAEARDAACAERASETQRTICRDADLTRRDAAIDAVYTELLGALSRTSLRKMRASHKDWSAAREACGGESICISVLTRLRLAVLEKRRDQAAGRAEEADGLRWRAGRAPDTDIPYSWLHFGIPETDANAVSGSCVDGSTAGFATVVFAYDARAHGLPVGEKLGVPFLARSKVVYLQGEVYEPPSGEGTSGVRVRIDFGSPIWEEMAEGAAIAYALDDAEPRALSLTKSRAAVTKFLADCKKNAHHSARKPEHSLEIRIKHATCDAVGEPGEGPAAGAPKRTVRIVNKTGSYRSIFRLDAGPTPGAALLNLNSGESGEITVAAGRRLMMTDGPGNCIEVLTVAGADVITLTTPSPGYDERDD